jgi:RHS repeat-associated protein
MILASGEGNSSEPGNRNPLAEITFYHQDALGSVMMLTDRNGRVNERYEYDAYGEAYSGKFDDENGRQIGNVYGFTGQRYESELGVYSFAFRDYNPRLMRWLEEDPLGDGLNWYLYCNSDPVNFFDPLGLCAKNPGIGPYKPEWYNSIPVVKDITKTVGDIIMVATLGDTNYITKQVYLPGERFQAAFESTVGTAVAYLTGEGIATSRVVTNVVSKMKEVVKPLTDIGKGLLQKISSSSEVILDTDAVIRYQQAKQLLKPGEIPVITKTTTAELNSLVTKGKLKGMPHVVNELKTISNEGSINSRINVRGKMQQIASKEGTRIRGNLIGDGINGATSLDTGRPIITFDKLLKKAIYSLGGDPR